MEGGGVSRVRRGILTAERAALFVVVLVLFRGVMPVTVIEFVICLFSAVVKDRSKMVAKSSVVPQ